MRIFIDGAELLDVAIGGGIEVQGNVAHDAADSGNPVSQGLNATSNISTTPSDVQSGDRVRATGTLKGAQFIAFGGTIGDGGSGYAGAVTELDSEAPLGVGIFGIPPDGNPDRLTTAGDTAGSGLGSLVVSPAGHAYNNVTADEQIMAAAGKLHTITIHDVTVAGVITVYDNTAESGTVIATLTLVAGESFYTLTYDVECATGLFIGYDGTVAADLTVSYAI